MKIQSPEEHFWLQATYNHSSGNLKLSHRLRQEYRFVGLAKPDVQGQMSIQDYAYRGRMRYMLTLMYPLWKEDKITKLSALLADEAFLNVGANSGATLFNQNRAIIGLSYNINPSHQIQLSYIHQNIWNFSNTIQENNPTIRLSYITNIDWR